MRQAPDFHVRIVGEVPQPLFDPDFVNEPPSGSGGGIPFWPFSPSPTAPNEHRPTQQTQNTKGTGMTGAEIAFLIAQIAGPALQGAFSDDPQERQSFEGKGSADPSYLMHKNQASLDSIMSMIMGRANAGVSLPSAVVQQPGAYSGGGLPMPIGLVASDPALANPGLLSKPGLGFDLSQFSGAAGAGTQPYDGGDDDATPDNPDYVDPGGYHDVDPPPGIPPRTAQPRPPDAPPSTGARRRMAAETPLFDEGALIDPGSDLQQALGSVDLLLQAFGGGARSARV